MKNKKRDDIFGRPVRLELPEIEALKARAEELEQLKQEAAEFFQNDPVFAGRNNTADGQKIMRGLQDS